MCTYHGSSVQAGDKMCCEYVQVWEIIRTAIMYREDVQSEYTARGLGVQTECRYGNLDTPIEAGCIDREVGVHAGCMYNEDVQT